MGIVFASHFQYNTIRNSGIISLPSDRQLLDLLNVKNDLAKYWLILIDEMYVKQGVVFEKSTVL